MVPDFPTDLKKKADPKPPKLLVQKTFTRAGIEVLNPIPYGGHIKSIKEPEEVIVSRLTSLVPVKDYSLRPHQYQKKSVNSRYDAKEDTPVSLKELSVQCPAYPIPYIPPRLSDFQDSQLLRNRRVDGTILGSYERRVVDGNHVPQLDGPLSITGEAKVSLADASNPVVDLDDTWSSCWDAEVGAVYYYNKLTGEATWIPP